MNILIFIIEWLSAFFCIFGIGVVAFSVVFYVPVKIIATIVWAILLLRNDRRLWKEFNLSWFEVYFMSCTGLLYLWKMHREKRHDMAEALEDR